MWPGRSSERRGRQRRARGRRQGRGQGPAAYVTSVAVVERVARRDRRDLHVGADVQVGLGVESGDRDVATCKQGGGGMGQTGGR
jgi:hypothetical protein